MPEVMVFKYAVIGYARHVIPIAWHYSLDKFNLFHILIITVTHLK